MLQNLKRKKCEQFQKLRNAVKDNKNFIHKINCKEMKKKEVGRNWMLTLDRKKFVVIHELRKEDWRNETYQHRKKGWQVNISRTEERNFDKELTAALAELINYI